MILFNLEMKATTKAEDKTEADVVDMVKARISEWALESNYGEETKDLKCANLRVRRFQSGRAGWYLKIPVANSTFGVVPFDNKAPLATRKALVESVIADLPNHSDGLFEKYQEVISRLNKNKNTTSTEEDSSTTAVAVAS